MRIGFYHECAARQQAGGIAVFVQELAIELAREHDVVLVTGDGEVVDYLADSSVRIRQVPGALPNDRSTRLLQRATPVRDQLARKLLTIVRARRAGILDWMDRTLDVVFTHQYFDDLLLSRLLETPTVFEYHGVQHVGPGSKLRERASTSSGHLANSHHTADVVRSEFGREVDGVVTPGVDTEQFSPDARPAFDGDNVVLFVGRFVPAKGSMDLLEAVSSMDSRPDVHLVGRGDLGTLRQRVRALGLEPIVTIHEPVSHSAIQHYFAAADVFCNPSHYESFCMVNLEAMACGTPVVTTATGGIPEYASNGSNAILVPPGEPDRLAVALETVLDSSERRAGLGRLGRETALEYSWSRSARALLPVLDGLVDRQVVAGR